MLSADQCDKFLEEGFVRVDDAFPSSVAAQARETFFHDLRAQGITEDPATWTRPVVRLGMYPQPHVVAAASTPRLHAAFDQLVGPGAWHPCRAMGTVPVRFPSATDPGDTGWHIDVSFGGDPDDFLSWRANVHSRGRALLMLFLFSDTGVDDAPTRIRVGSHRDMARALALAGEAGLSLRELLPHFASAPAREEVQATGPAGTVFLCHPFLVHAAQVHRGTTPRFLAQPPLLPVADRWLPGGPGADRLVAQAIAQAAGVPEPAS
ncbi:MAG TPA: phytanoyl-CoA dioxygenase family protein [Steroidobacteraceae bacterium]|nr:phytanoyl-CoA dioxygenase family protein [Steroidobacteraceae bacterium]